MKFCILDILLSKLNRSVDLNVYNCQNAVCLRMSGKIEISGLEPEILDDAGIPLLTKLKPARLNCMNF
jgi:hypothetical protein